MKELTEASWSLPKTFHINQDGVKSSGIGIYVSGSLEALVKLNYRAPEKYSYDEREEIGIKTLEEVALVAGGSSSAIFSSSSSQSSNTSASTHDAINTHARNLIGDALTGSPQLNQNSFDAKFYNLGEGRYGMQLKGKALLMKSRLLLLLDFRIKFSSCR